jgi:HAD superfamily hydrolase (TIGR01490 family)
MGLKPAIAFFDMDHTLMDNDCDVSWKDFLVDEKLADPSEKQEADRFWRLYNEGRLPIEEFLDFQLRQFIGHTPQEMLILSQRHFEKVAQSLIYPKAKAEVDKARSLNMPVVMLTATNRIVAQPVAEKLGFTDVIATELEVLDGRYTGKITGQYCIKQGKVDRAMAFCESLGLSLDRVIYYGDSVSDIPMLKKVGFPVAINPEGELLELARERGWRIENWSL